MNAMFKTLKKLKNKGKKLFHIHSSSRSRTDQSILTGQSTPSLTLPGPVTHIPHHPSTSLQALTAQPDDLVPLSNPTSNVSTVPPSTEESQSKSMKIAKDALKTSLVLLNAALPGLPFKGAFTAAIEIIKIAEVRMSYNRRFEPNFSYLLCNPLENGGKRGCIKGACYALRPHQGVDYCCLKGEGRGSGAG